MANLFSRVYEVGVSTKKGEGMQNIHNEFVMIKNRMFSWCADPFPIEYKGELYIFAELFKFIGSKGVIAYTKKNKEGFDKWKIVIEEPYHLSFPNIFLWNNSYYMCPEANESKKIYLYKCEKFPDVWKKSKVLVEGGRFCDTVFFNDEGNVYGITYELDGDLKMFNCNNFEISNGKIITSSDDDNRPGGKIFYDRNHGNIIVSQIGKPRYGSGLVFKKVNINWPNYQEEEIMRVYPSDILCDKRRKYNGIHTYNMSENYCVIDMIYNKISIVDKIFKGLKVLKRMTKNAVE